MVAAAQATSRFTSALDVAAQINTLYTTNTAATLQSTYLPTSNKFQDVSGGSAIVSTSVPTACSDAVLALAQTLFDLNASKTIPTECTAQDKVRDAAAFKLECLFAVGDALAVFDNATTELYSADTDILGRTGLATATMCDVSDIVSLDGKFGIYRNLVNYAIFGSYLDGGFESAYLDLPCKDAFQQFLTNLPSGARASVAVDAKCGTSSGSPKIFENPCRTASWSGTSISVEISSLITKLGLAGSDYTFDRVASTRCSANEASVLKSLNIYNAMVQCSRTKNPLVGADVAAFTECVGNGANYWSTNAETLFGTSAFSCAECFLRAGSDIRNLVIAANSDSALCAASSFSTDCVNNLGGRNILDTTYTCSGVEFDVVSSICSAVQFATLGASMGSVLPYLIAVKKGLADTIENIASGKQAAALAAMTNYMNVTSLSTVPCGSCANGLVVELASILDGNSDLMNSCNDEYSVACVKHSAIVAAMATFKKCSGITLTTDAPFTCSADDSDLLSNGGVYASAFTAITNYNTTTAASVLTTIMNKITAIETTNNVVIPCKSCFADVVTGLFGLPAAIVSGCNTIGADGCMRLPAVQQIAFKYQECSGNPLSFAAASTETTTPPTNTTSPDSKSASISAPVATLVVAAIGAMLAL